LLASRPGQGDDVLAIRAANAITRLERNTVIDRLRCLSRRLPTGGDDDVTMTRSSDKDATGANCGRTRTLRNRAGAVHLGVEVIGWLNRVGLLTLERGIAVFTLHEDMVGGRGHERSGVSAEVEPPLPEFGDWD
jgi:hypothetical protein